MAKLWITIATLSVILLSFYYLHPTHSEKNENNVLLERIEYQLKDQSLYSYNNVVFKAIAHNVYRINITSTFTRPINELYVHFVLYYKYTTYRKFLIDIWEDGCAFLNSSLTAPVARLAVENTINLGVKMNFKLECPFSGTLIFVHDGLNFSHVNVPLFPAGRYRLDISLASPKKRNIYLEIQAFYTISDIRLWHWMECNNQYFMFK